jgi:hypothetical protein
VLAWARPHQSPKAPPPEIQVMDAGFDEPIPIARHDPLTHHDQADREIVGAPARRAPPGHRPDPLPRRCSVKSSPNWSHSWSSNSPLSESQAFHATIASALAAVQLEESLSEKYDKFFQSTSLDEIMKKHGIP